MAPKEGNGTTNCVNSLLDLLTVVSLDTVDNSLLDREAERCVIELRQSRDSLPDDPQAWDRQVEKLIRQLRESVRETPERDIDLLKDPDMRLHYSSPDPEPEYKPQMPPAQRDDPDASEDRRQYLEREFSSTSYPKIGPGYSDSISVVSDLTTPTVVQGDVPEEENYPAGPPLSIGFTPKPRSQLRRPSMENKNGGGGGERSGGENNAVPSGGERREREDRRAVQQHLRPPSRRIVTRPAGGAAASRRQNHQMTMAHLQAATPVTPSRGSANSGDRKPAPVAMSVNDFPSLKDASRGGDPKPRRERRSLLRKSNKYAASVSATASQRMLLARQESVKQESAVKQARRRSSNRRRSTGDAEGFESSEGLAPALDSFGFYVGAEADPFASSAFNVDFPSTSSFTANFNDSKASNNSFFPASSKDTKRKKGSSRRASSDYRS